MLIELFCKNYNDKQEQERRSRLSLAKAGVNVDLANENFTVARDLKDFIVLIVTGFAFVGAGLMLLLNGSVEKISAFIIMAIGLIIAADGYLVKYVSEKTAFSVVDGVICYKGKNFRVMDVFKIIVDQKGRVKVIGNENDIIAKLNERQSGMEELYRWAIKNGIGIEQI